MTFTDPVDLTTDIGKVRQFIFDLDPARPIFPDDQMIQNFLDVEGGDVKLAAAFALETIAGNRAMTLQVMTILDLKLDGYSVAKGLRETAKSLRESAGGDWDGLLIAEVVDTEFQWRERVLKTLLVNDGV